MHVAHEDLAVLVSEKLIQIMFQMFEMLEIFHVQAYYAGIQPILALFSLGKTTALSGPGRRRLAHGVDRRGSRHPACDPMQHHLGRRSQRVCAEISRRVGHSTDVCDLNIATRIKKTAC
jgi:hypothetical protein